MKELSKVKLYMKKSLYSILLEKQILSNLHYSLIANLNFSFQDKEYLYLILDYLPGGDLRYYMNNGMIFNESQIKFFISNLILSLKYIHNNNILHRDLKPENLIFDDKGYLHLTDFGISRKIKNGKPILNKSGTPGYISPEVLLNQPQSFSSDFFSMGVICYELFKGKKPFKGKNKKEIAEKILYKDTKLKKKDIPENYSIEFGDFINKLLRRNRKERLGNKNIEEIINHPWLNGIDWEIIELKLVDIELIPFIPPIGDNFDANIANKKENMNMDNYGEYLKKINDSGYLKNFYFNYFTSNALTKCKIIYEKKSIGDKYTTVTEGRKSSPDQSFIEPEFNDDITNDNYYISGNKSTDLYNSRTAKKDNDKEISDFPRKSKTNKLKSNTITKRRIKGYDKEELDEIERIKLFGDNNDNN